MAYWDFGYNVDVYDSTGRRSQLVFLPTNPAETSANPTVLGHVALDYGDKTQSRFLRLTKNPTTFSAAQNRIGDLSRDCHGPNVPPNCRSAAADADVIAAKLHTT